jgi:hypothetical protein
MSPFADHPLESKLENIFVFIQHQSRMCKRKEKNTDLAVNYFTQEKK